MLPLGRREGDIRGMSGRFLSLLTSEAFDELVLELKMAERKGKRFLVPTNILSNEALIDHLRTLAARHGCSKEVIFQATLVHYSQYLHIAQVYRDHRAAGRPVSELLANDEEIHLTQQAESYGLSIEALMDLMFDQLEQYISTHADVFQPGNDDLNPDESC